MTMTMLQVNRKEGRVPRISLDIKLKLLKRLESAQDEVMIAGLTF